MVCWLALTTGDGVTRKHPSAQVFRFCFTVGGDVYGGVAGQVFLIKNCSKI